MEIAGVLSNVMLSVAVMMRERKVYDFARDMAWDSDGWLYRFMMAPIHNDIIAYPNKINHAHLVRKIPPVNLYATS